VSAIRSAEQIRHDLERRRRRMASDLRAIEERIREGVNPLRLAVRRPLLTVALGGLLGILVARRPAGLAGAAGRVLGFIAPLVFSALARRSFEEKPGR
jgi:hypothetical protein